MLNTRYTWIAPGGNTEMFPGLRSVASKQLVTVLVNSGVKCNQNQQHLLMLSMI